MSTVTHHDTEKLCHCRMEQVHHTMTQAPRACHKTQRTHYVDCQSLFSSSQTAQVRVEMHQVVFRKGKESQLHHPDRCNLFPSSGESAARTVRAALGQFESCVGISMPANMVVFRFVDDHAKAIGIVERAAKEGAMVVYTIVNPDMINSIRTALRFYNVRGVNLWSKLLDSMESHLEQNAIRQPLGFYNEHKPRKLSRDYFRLINAVEYTRKMDDGAFPSQWKVWEAAGSRTRHTAISKKDVANLPLVPGLPIPKQLYELDQRKVVGLTMDPKPAKWNGLFMCITCAQVLHAIRTNRMDMMGVGEHKTEYVQLSK
eukprot:scaffold154295_cov36-Prasinocladus_malaysianus.AAC.1